MADAKVRRSKGAKGANAPMGDDVKTSITVSRRLHSRWQAAASLAGMTANALAVEALDAATRWVVIHDKRKSADRADTEDIGDHGADVNSEGDSEAA